MIRVIFEYLEDNTTGQDIFTNWGSFIKWKNDNKEGIKIIDIIQDIQD